mmetsp:Transcript_59614/g.98373  ORF Transcript_59614/g.98373 Transcript_59614/m.98373 type:complete len:289 (-) Transcript_59614:967-1833(-)
MRERVKQIRGIKCFWISIVWNVANRCLNRIRHIALFLVATIKNPFNHAQILTETWPQNSALVFAEPVHHKHFRQLILGRFILAKREPMPKVIAHIVATKRSHRKRIQTQHTTQTSRGRRRLGRHGRAGKHAMVPVETLVRQWYCRGAASAKQDTRDRYTIGVTKLCIQHWTLMDAHTEACIRMCRWRGGPRSMLVSIPCNHTFRRRIFGHTLPPYIALIRNRHIGKDCVLLNHCHRVLVTFVRSAGRDSKKSILWIDSIQFAIGSFSNPCDIIAETLHFPFIAVLHGT